MLRQAAKASRSRSEADAPGVPAPRLGQDAPPSPSLAHWPAPASVPPRLCTQSAARFRRRTAGHTADLRRARGIPSGQSARTPMSTPARHLRTPAAEMSLPAHAPTPLWRRTTDSSMKYFVAEEAAHGGLRLSASLSRLQPADNRQPPSTRVVHAALPARAPRPIGKRKP